jgi:hypothetical protein
VSASAVIFGKNSSEVFGFFRLAKGCGEDASYVLAHLDLEALKDL